MIRNIGNTYKNMRVRLDGNHFEQCVFRQCVLEFGASDDVGLVECAFHNCSWEFVGSAATTIKFMTGLYSGLGPEGQKLIEETFDDIRRGAAAQISANDNE